MKVPMQTIVSSVLRKLDENEELVREKESYGIAGTKLVDLIEDMFEEVASQIILRAPDSSLSDYCEAETEVEWDGPGRGSVLLPADFLRLGYFRMSDWKRAVTRVIEHGSESYDLRFWPSAGRCGIRKAPAVSIRDGRESGGGAGGRHVLEFIGSKDPGAYVERLGYIPVPAPDAEGLVSVPDRLLPEITDMLAKRVRGIRNLESAD